MKGYIFKRGLIRYFILGLFLVIFLPVAILCTVGIRRAGKELSDDNLEYMALIAESISYDMDKAISEYDNLTMFALVQDQLLDILYKENYTKYEYLETYNWLNEQFLIDMYMREALFSNFQIIGNNGFYYTSDYESERLDAEHMLRDIKRDGSITIFMPYSIDGRRDKNHVTIGRYINSYKDLKPLGYFLVNIKTTELDKIWENKNQNQYNVWIFDSEGNVIYGENEDTGSGCSFFENCSLKRGSFYAGKGNGKCFYVYQKSGYTGWTSVLEMPVSVYQKPLADLRGSFLIAGVLSFVLAAGLSYVLISRILRQIYRLKNTLETEDNGELIKITGEIPDNEVGDLMNTYNRMVDKNKELNRQVLTAELRQKQTELLQNRAELKALQTQINPHFLYNTLGAINLYSVMEDSEAVQGITGALGDMFRYAVQNPLEPVKITDEIAHVKSYLKIQKYRLGVMPQVEFDTGDFKEAFMLRLTLQPIVENVFKHGFADGIRPEHRIRIQTRSRDGKLAVDVIDNGKGPTWNIEPMEFIPDDETKGKGIGLSNVHRRIQLAYGQEYGLHISGIKGEGMTITVIMPLNFGQTGE